MEQKSKTSNSLKLGVLALLLILVITPFIAVKKAVEVEDKIDSRFYSYDNLFFQSNSVVVDSSGNIIGDVYIHTNNKEIEDFYSDTTRIKTMYYYNLKNRKLKIIEEK